MYIHQFRNNFKIAISTNAILKYEHFTQFWKTDKIITIPKSAIENIRPITLPCNLSKTIEKN